MLNPRRLMAWLDVEGWVIDILPALKDEAFRAIRGKSKMRLDSRQINLDFLFQTMRVVKIKTFFNACFSESVLASCCFNEVYGVEWFETKLDSGLVCKSQTCVACGHVAKENRPDQATFRCVACGHTANADVNAAQNILLRALREEEAVAPSQR